MDAGSMSTPSLGAPRLTARRLLEGEALLARHVPRARVLRLGGIYGPERTRMVRSVIDGEASRPRRRTLHQPHPPGRRGPARQSICSTRPVGVYVGVDQDQAPLSEVQEWIAARAGVAPPSLEPDGSPRRGNKRCDGARLRETGFTLAYPTFREGYGPIVDDLVS